MDSLSGIQITERRKRLVGKNPLLKLMPGPELHQYLTAKDVRGCIHVSCMKSERVLVSDRNNLIQTNVTGDTLHHIYDLYSDEYCGLLSVGLHTVNNDGELLYIDMDYNVKKISKDIKSTDVFIKQCVSWSRSVKYLLVGRYKEDTERGKKPGTTRLDT